MQVTGIDIGGSHITAGIVDRETGALHRDFMIRRPVDCHAAAEKILDSWCEAIEALWDATGTGKVPLAFAMPGPFDYAHGICLIKGYGKYEALYQMDIRQQLSERLGLSPADIRFRNDAAAFLAGEVRAGAAKGAAHAIGMTLGTGMGTARSHNGTTEDAELSFRVKVNGVTIEEEISTRGLLRHYARFSGKAVKDVRELADLYPGDADARRAFRIFAEHLSDLLLLFIREEQPEVAVIGGNIAAAWELFMPEVLDRLARDMESLPRIVKASLGEQAALCGAAALFSQ